MHLFSILCKFKNAAKENRLILFLTILLIYRLTATYIDYFFVSKVIAFRDSYFYLHDQVSSFSPIRTIITQKVAQSTLYIFGEFGAYSFFSIISCVGFIYFLFKGTKDNHLMQLLPIWIVMSIMPSNFIFLGIVGKEALFFGFYTLALFFWGEYLRKKNINFSEIFLLVIALLVCFLLRPHYSIALITLFLSTYFYMKIHQHYLLLISITIMWLVVFFITKYYLWNDLLLHGYASISPSGNLSRHIPLNVDYYSTAGFEKFKSYILYAIPISLLGPTLSECLNRMTLLPFFIEGLIYFMLPTLSILYLAYKNKTENLKVFVYCLFPAILYTVIIHAPFGLLNPGSAIRWRTNFQGIFFLAPYILLISNLKKSTS